MDRDIMYGIAKLSNPSIGLDLMFFNQ